MHQLIQEQASNSLYILAISYYANATVRAFLCFYLLTSELIIRKEIKPVNFNEDFGGKYLLEPGFELTTFDFSLAFRDHGRGH